MSCILKALSSDNLALNSYHTVAKNKGKMYGVLVCVSIVYGKRDKAGIRDVSKCIGCRKVVTIKNVVLNLAPLLKLPHVFPLSILVLFPNGETSDTHVFSDVLDDKGAESTIRDDR